jgi:anti-anti-sigma factor
MSLQIGINSTNDVFVITLAGSFVFSAHRDFRKARENALESNKNKIEIDMGKVEYLDSSALGMLLLLREKANASNRKVSLTHCHDLVQEVLNMAHFRQLFIIQ